MTRFDAIIIGAGQAGPSLAGRLTGAGMKVALIERKLFGGTCVNTGCMPTKTLIASAYAAHLARRAADFGVVTGGPVSIDFGRVKARVERVVAEARTGVERWLRSMSGCTVLQGHARFEAPDTVRVGDQRLTAPRIFVNVGGRALVPELPGVHDVRHLTNRSILELERVPEHLIVIGGSYVGLEFAQAYRRFGARVTVVEKVGRLVGREDPDVSDAIREILEREGVLVRTGAECIALAPDADGIKVRVECTEGAPDVIGSHVLLAVGRTPNTDDLGLEHAGVGRDARGYIEVDDALGTSVPGIWALGECNGRGAFTHTAYNDFEIIAANLLDGERRRISDRVLGYALFLDPPLGRAGMTETQARATGARLLVGKRPMTRVGRAIEKDETAGFMKIVVNADARQILGAAVLGTGGDEAVHGVLDTMSAALPFPVLKWAVPIHPTVSELIPTLLSELQPVAPEEDRGPAGETARAVTAAAARSGALDLDRPVAPSDHVRGSPRAKVTLVEYADFECPFCARAVPVIRALESRFGSDLRVVFRHNPRAFAHPHAAQAAEAAEAAGEQGKFWEMHDMLFENQNALERSALITYAQRLDLDIERFTSAVDSRAHRAKVRADELSGVRSRVISTPTFFLNGRRFVDTPDIETLALAVDAVRCGTETAGA